mmetsp:Transcript_44279/g.114496  ORF Transcript_44279/g.114496 Transcript_44279/m.114496 type:complete len:250 (+) Transcript_44279:238-987(+)
MRRQPRRAGELVRKDGGRQVGVEEALAVDGRVLEAAAVQPVREGGLARATRRKGPRPCRQRFSQRAAQRWRLVDAHGALRPVVGVAHRDAGHRGDRREGVQLGTAALGPCLLLRQLQRLIELLDAHVPTAILVKDLHHRREVLVGHVEAQLLEAQMELLLVDGPVATLVEHAEDIEHLGLQAVELSLDHAQHLVAARHLWQLLLHPPRRRLPLFAPVAGPQQARRRIQVHSRLRAALVDEPIRRLLGIP